MQKQRETRTGYLTYLDDRPTFRLFRYGLLKYLRITIQITMRCRDKEEQDAIKSLISICHCQSLCYILQLI